MLSLLVQVACIDTEIDVRDLYDELPKAKAAAPPACTKFQLHSMFCYYGQHYHAFIHKEEVRGRE